MKGIGLKYNNYPTSPFRPRPLFVQSLGIDPVHFGLVVTLNLMIGILTPPFGTGLFMLQEVGRLSFEDATKACLPWIVPLLAVLLLITVVPEVVLYLPRAMGW